MGLSKWFYMREDLKSDYPKLRIYKGIFTIGLVVGLVLLIVSLTPPVIPFGVFAGGFSAVIGGYFLISIRMHVGGKW